MEDTKVIMSSGLGINLDRVYPVGSIYLSVSNTSPNELFGGVWEKFSEGKMLIGASDKYPLNSSGGREQITLTTDNLPAHNHTASTNTIGNHNHNRGNMEIYGYADLGGVYSASGGNAFRVSFNGGNARGASHYQATNDQKARIELFASRNWTGTTNTTGNHSHTVTVNNTGSSKPFSIMNPYIAVNIWRRTA